MEKNNIHQFSINLKTNIRIEIVINIMLAIESAYNGNMEVNKTLGKFNQDNNRKFAQLLRGLS